MILKMSPNVNYACGEVKPLMPMPVKFVDMKGTTDMALAHFTNAEQLSQRASVLNLPFISVDKRYFNGYGSVMIPFVTKDKITLVETVLSRYITLCLRFNHLEKLYQGLQQKPSFNYLSRKKINDALDSLRKNITSLAKQSALTAHVIRSIVEIQGGRISFTSTNLSTMFISGMLMRNGYNSAVTSLPKFDELSFINIPTGSGVAETLVTESKKNLDFNSRDSSVSIEAEKFYDLSVRKDILTNIVNNLKNLSSCSDLLFNLVLFKDEFTTSESFMRGLSIFKNLELLDQTLGDKTIHKLEFVNNFNELYEVCVGKTLSRFVSVTDLDVHHFKDSNTSIIYSLTTLQVISLLSHPNSKKVGNEIYIGSLKLEVPSSAIVLTQLAYDEIIDIVELIWCISSLAHGCVSKVNLDDSSISVNLTKFLSNVDRNFACGLA